MEEGYILNDGNRLFLEAANIGSIRFACRVQYLRGLSVGWSVREHFKNKDFLISSELDPHFERMHLSWLHWYGSVQIQVVTPDGDGFRFARNGDLCFTLTDNHPSDPVPVIALGAEIVERNLTKCLDGITLTNRYTLCQSGLCSRGYGVWIVRKIGDKWLCDDCVDRFSLEEPLPQIQPQATCREQTERAKLMPGLRWDILCRDNFTCRTCGKSPRKGDDVKLHVDHIKPIHHGGLTTPDNLQVLCQDCNLGKSAKWSRQIELALDG